MGLVILYFTNPRAWSTAVFGAVVLGALYWGLCDCGYIVPSPGRP